jgi:hypothetical protein
MRGEIARQSAAKSGGEQAGRGSTKANNHLAAARGGLFASAEAIAEINGFMK